jgi:hypothetical protein
MTRLGGQEMPRAQDTRGPVLEKIWLQHYPAGVPADINPSEYGSLL